ncbi:MAG: hypothetical protein M3P45_09190 [Acidobacteriota bacterium]|nr:hypothetical protein [Acidobacteriota bacterium]
MVAAIIAISAQNFPGVVVAVLLGVKEPPAMTKRRGIRKLFFNFLSGIFA